MRLVDLTHPISTGMQVFPGDPEVRLHSALAMESDGVAVTGVQFGSHTGTHLDAPSHTVPGGRTLSEIGLEELTGETLVLHLPGLVADERIGWERLATLVPDTVPAIVLLATGWDRHFGSDLYLRHPVLCPQAAGELWRRGMRVLALDTLNPDPTLPSGQEPAAFAVHELVLGGDGLIIENVRGAQRLPDRCRTGFFPLRLEYADGAPVRAVAWI